MKNGIIVLILAAFLCNGCTSNSVADEESVKNYNSFIDAVKTNKGIVSEEIPFDYTLDVTKQQDNSYRYQVQISNPKIAMYNIQMIVINPAVDSNTNVYPCIGLLGDDVNTDFIMVPFQSNNDENYVKGISLDGVSKSDKFTLNALVSWKNKSRQQTSRAFFTKHFALESDDQENGVKKTSDQLSKEE